MNPILLQLSVALSLVPNEGQDDDAGREAWECLKRAVNSGAIPEVHSWHVSRAEDYEERDEREHQRGRGSRIHAVKLRALVRARLGTWVAHRVRNGGKVTARGVLSQRPGALLCDAIAEFVRAEIPE